MSSGGGHGKWKGTTVRTCKAGCSPGDSTPASSQEPVLRVLVGGGGGGGGGKGRRRATQGV